jgi:hypothetical protein
MTTKTVSFDMSPNVAAILKDSLEVGLDGACQNEDNSEEDLDLGHLIMCTLDAMIGENPGATISVAFTVTT